MAGFDGPAFYGDRWAEVYDERHAGLDPSAAVEFLAGLSGGGRMLELAIGTGRVALPLASRGIAVEGVGASQAMVDRLRAKPGGPAIPVTIGDLAQVPVRGPFRLVYLVFNSLFGLLDQARQADCLASVARVLDPGGCSSSNALSPTWRGLTAGSGRRRWLSPKTPQPCACPATTLSSSASRCASSRWMGTACTCDRWRCAIPGPVSWI
jgi:SAM-dependent methyltransferase